MKEKSQVLCGNPPLLENKRSAGFFEFISTV